MKDYIIQKTNNHNIKKYKKNEKLFTRKNSIDNTNEFKTKTTL